jgi:hypothetical protein
LLFPLLSCMHACLFLASYFSFMSLICLASRLSMSDDGSLSRPVDPNESGAVTGTVWMQWFRGCVSAAFCACSCVSVLSALWPSYWLVLFARSICPVIPLGLLVCRMDGSACDPGTVRAVASIGLIVHCIPANLHILLTAMPPFYRARRIIRTVVCFGYMQLSSYGTAMLEDVDGASHSNTTHFCLFPSLPPFLSCFSLCFLACMLACLLASCILLFFHVINLFGLAIVYVRWRLA